MSRRDADIQREVLQEVNWVPSLRQERLEVTVRRGVATLRGTLSTMEQLRAAEQAVRKVNGVTCIAEQVKLRSGTDASRRDDDLRRRALDSLRHNVQEPTRVTIRVADGWITVDGEVENHFQRDAVGLSLAALFGAAGVSNHLTVRPAVDERDVRRHIADALCRRAEREAEAIRITISGRTVTLAGTAATIGERFAIEEAARAARGVSQVELHIRVTG